MENTRTTNMYFINFHLSVARLTIYESRQGFVHSLSRVVVPATGTRIPDPPFSSFGPSRDYGMDLCLDVYL